MLAHGVGYFDHILPHLGPLRNGRPHGHKASFFCLENEHRRIIGLDTGDRAIATPLLPSRSRRPAARASAGLAALLA